MNNHRILSQSHRFTTRQLLRRAFVFASVVMILAGYATAPARAMSGTQQNIYQLGIHYFDDQVRSCSGDLTLVGSDNEQKTWNFFKGQGLDDIHTAAVMGNIKQESGFNPTIMEIGGNSQNPADAGAKGYGLAQWTPGIRIITIAQQQNVSGPIYELGTQLQIIWGEMNTTAPTGFKNLLVPFKQTTTVSEATEFFRRYYESGTEGNRQAYAAAIYQKYSGGAPGSGGVVGSGGCAAGATSCTSALGNTKILCAAKLYDTVSYEESAAAGHQGAVAWHATCPVIGPSCVLDCSGLVNIAVYDVFGVDLREDTKTLTTDTKNWQHINVSDVQPGDLVLPNTNHVEIVDHVSGNTIFTFGAHTSTVPQPSQVGPAQYSKDQIMTALRWTGS